MKVTVVQPWYSLDHRDIDRCFEDMLALADACDDSMDIIVFPEYCDVPAATPDGEAFRRAVEKYNEAAFRKFRETARRCRAMVFANFAAPTDGGWANATWAFDREGNVAGKYLKAHPAPSEEKTIARGGNQLDCSYSYEYRPPYVLEMEGVRFAFLTCYDFYMYEMFPAIARQNVDVIIGCSHQRTDTHAALEIIGRFLCYNTDAYLLRSSVSLGEGSDVCGCSMIVAPDGEMLANMGSGIGMVSREIDPHRKYLKPAGFRGRLMAHWEYADQGRRPWLYRPAGSMTVPDDDHIPYPRVCAHRGFNSIAPENSMPAFGAAVALGAEEIEFDIWATKDGELVSIHDPSLDRVSDGTGKVSDYTFEELQRFDFGRKRGERFNGLRIIRFEDILKKFACSVIMNIHVKIWDTHEDVDRQYGRIAGLIRQYGCEKHVYMMTGNEKCMAEFRTVAPDIHRCMGFGNCPKDDPLEHVRRAIRQGCQKIQLFKPYFTQESVDMAHEHGILCNVFYADDPEEACRYIDMGIDTILTNDYLQISNAVRRHLAEKAGE